ncbi:MAG TPA: hypothetical protein VGF86_14990 [Candidatus Tumulicola sp.]|jgi:hypothetical protein
MLALAQVALHVGLCNALARVPQGQPVDLRVRLTDRTGLGQLDRTFEITRGRGSTLDASFQVPGGIYRMDVSAPGSGCQASSIQYFADRRYRSVPMRLSDGPAEAAAVSYIFTGTVAASPVDVQPTPVLFGGDTQCDEPTDAPLPARASVEYDGDSYYAWLYSDSTFAKRGSLTLALRLRLDGGLHYVYVPLPYPVAGSRWPVLVHADLTHAMLVALAPQPVGWLLCQKLSLSSSK